MENKNIVDKRVLGKHRGLVTNISDPSKSGMIKVRCPDVLGDYESDWALPCLPYAIQDGGFLFLPNVGDMVWVEFEDGNLEKPIYTGFLWRTGEAPHNSNTERVLIDKFKNKIVLSEKGVEIKDKHGNVFLSDESGVTVSDKDDNKIVTSSSGIDFKDTNGNTMNFNGGGISIADKDGNTINAGGNSINLKDNCGNEISTDKGRLKISDSTGSFIQMTNEGLKILENLQKGVIIETKGVCELKCSKYILTETPVETENKPDVEE